LLRLLASPDIASKELVYRQYDHQVMDNTVVLPGSDAAVLRIKGTRKGISLTTDGNGRYCYLDPYLGGVIAVAEAARNLACSGAEPLAITDCLNFGNPERGDVYYQLKSCIKGMARACRELRIPVISGNVSLYNETKGQAIYPTPVVGMVGIVSDINRCCTMSFKTKDDVVFLLGGMMENGIGGSEYLESMHGLVKGRPYIDLGLEKRVQKCCVEAIRHGFVKSAHDCSEGGLAVAIAESCIAGDIGFVAEGWNIKGRLDSALFGEHQSQIVVSMPSNSVAEVDKIARKWQVPLIYIGKVGSKRLSVKSILLRGVEYRGDLFNLSLDKLGRAWHHGLKWQLGM
jgi:phosphoribosylformylglycinamidine synthase